MTPDTTPEPTPGRILGIGGIFFKSADHEVLRAWYQNQLGIENGDSGAVFRCGEQTTAWCIFPSTTAYFNPSESTFMVNYIVDDLDAFLGKCARNGVRIDDKREDCSYGRFAWIYDPDGNKIELWQSVEPASPQ